MTDRDAVRDPYRFLFVTWESGGGAMPMIGTARMLAERGHDVRVLGPGGFRDRIAAAGCEFRPLPADAQHDPTLGRALENQPAFLMRTLTGSTVPRAVVDEATREPTDALVVDYMLSSTLAVGERVGPTAALVHTPYRFHSGSERPEVRQLLVSRVDRVRAELDLEPLALPDDSPFVRALLARCEVALVAMPEVFDPWPTPITGNIRHVGPIFEERAGSHHWDAPWPPDDERPLVVVSFSTQYMHQENALERVATALAALPVRALILTGHELRPDELGLPEGVACCPYVPHAAVLPHAALVVTHAGMGTVVAALVHGVPLLCTPMGRDQHGNAARVEELGAGVELPSDASVTEIRNAARALLDSPSVAASVHRLAATISAYASGEQAVAILEALCSTRPTAEGGEPPGRGGHASNEIADDGTP